MVLCALCLWGTEVRADAPESSTGIRSAAAEVALQQVGRPYRYGGDHPHEGFDCSGLVRYAYGRLGVALPRTSAHQYRSSRPVSLSVLRPGDLLFFHVSAGKVSHVGIYVGDGAFVHAPSSGKSVQVSRLENPFWQQHLRSARRVDPVLQHSRLD